jgi:hypothetical protein
MILARIRLLGISSADGCLEVKVENICVLDTPEFSVELPADFHERLAAKLAEAESFTHESQQSIRRSIEPDMFR